MVMDELSRMPRFGDCWKTALAELEHGCGNLDEDVQSRMALGFANCFLQKAGLRNASFIFDHNIFKSVSEFYPSLERSWDFHRLLVMTRLQ